MLLASSLKFKVMQWHPWFLELHRRSMQFRVLHSKMPGAPHIPRPEPIPPRDPEPQPGSDPDVFPPPVNPEPETIPPIPEPEPMPI